LLAVSFVNQGQVRAKGLELEAQMRLPRESRVLASYALQSAVDQQTDLELPNSPRHVAKARLSVPLFSPGSSLAFEAQYLSGRATLVGTTVPGATTLNVHVVQPLSRSWEIIGGVRNIFDNEYLDPVSGQHLQDAIPQNGRTARIGLRWKFWTP
jgi:outer membrane receptor protein involved in Fe transport